MGMCSKRRIWSNLRNFYSNKNIELTLDWVDWSIACEVKGIKRLDKEKKLEIVVTLCPLVLEFVHHLWLDNQFFYYYEKVYRILNHCMYFFIIIFHCSCELICPKLSHQCLSWFPRLYYYQREILLNEQVVKNLLQKKCFIYLLN